MGRSEEWRKGKGRGERGLGGMSKRWSAAGTTANPSRRGPTYVTGQGDPLAVGVPVGSGRTLGAGQKEQEQEEARSHAL